MKKNSLLSIIFFILITLPATGMVLKVNDHRSDAPLPAKSPQMELSLAAVQKFPREYMRYFNDNFGFRKLLLRLNFIARHDLLGTSPSKQVVIGKEGWLFFAGDGETEDYRGITRYDHQTLEAWARSLQLKKTWLEKQGIRYLFVIPPNKSSIYGEFLPDSYNKVRGTTALDDLVAHVRATTDVTILDLRPMLLAEKRRHLLYLKTDTHWNGYGAYIAYREIMKPVARWFPGMYARSFDEFDVMEKSGGGGDISNLLGGIEFLQDEHVLLRPKNGPPIMISDINDMTKSPVTFQRPMTSLPRALVFRDSFFSTLAPLLAEHFQFSQYFWQPWDGTVPADVLITASRPDIVIEEIAERLLKTKMTDFNTVRPEYLNGSR